MFIELRLQASFTESLGALVYSLSIVPLEWKLVRTLSPFFIVLWDMLAEAPLATRARKSRDVTWESFTKDWVPDEVKAPF